MVSNIISVLLLYENNGVTVGDFQIQVPFDVTYDWGTICVYVVCKISKTQTNLSKKPGILKNNKIGA